MKKKPAPRAQKTKEQLRAEALLLLDTTEEAIADSPAISHLLRDIGQVRVLEFLSGSSEPEARAVVKLRARLTRDMAETIPFEAYCVAAGVPVKKMFGIIASECSEQSVLAARLLSKASHPAVVKATVDAAMFNDGSADRKMLHQAEGFVPVPRNSVTHIHGDVDARTQTQNIAVLPPVEESVRRLADRFNNGMSMPVLSAAAESLEDEDESDEDE